jgi:aminobenzoyl-glutamate utilization protein B
MMTGTADDVARARRAWPIHSNKAVAEAMYANIQSVGLPQWSADDEKLAVALQKELKVPEVGLAKKIDPLRGAEKIPDEAEAVRRARTTSATSRGTCRPSR